VCGLLNGSVFSLRFRGLFCSFIDCFVAFDIFMTWDPLDLSMHIPRVVERFDLFDCGDEDSLARLFVGIIDASNRGLTVGIYDALCE